MQPCNVGRYLRAVGLPALGPAEGRDAVRLEEGVLLLDPEPRLLLLGLLHHVGGLDARVAVDGRAVRLEAVAHHEDVLALAEGVRVDGAGLEHHL